MAQHRIQQIEDYEPLIGGEKVERIREKAQKFKGLRVANFNSTYYGGGVAEMLSSMTLLMNSLGLRTEWRVIQGTPDFFSITKKMHNALQGGDPQPLGLIEYYKKKCPWLWRCHIDLSRPQEEMWKYLRPWIDKYATVIVSCPEDKHEMTPPQRVFMPAINPFNIKNRDLSDKEIDERLAHDKSQPICRWSCKSRASIRGRIRRA